MVCLPTHLDDLYGKSSKIYKIIMDPMGKHGAFLRQTREKISTLDFFDNVSITLPLNWGPNQKRKRSHDISGHKRETT